MKKIPFFFVCFLTVFICVFSLCFLPYFSKKTVVGEDMILEIWQVDCFEGGTGSRRAYVERAAKNFCSLKNEKNKNGAKISCSVKSHTVYSAEKNFDSGVYPDVISFGSGLDLPYDRLVPLDFSCGVAGEYNGETYAAVWAAGCYCLITKKGESAESLIIGVQNYNLPILACKLSLKNLPEKVEYINSENCFYEFYSRKNCGWVGTHRDLYRVSGKVEVNVEPLSGYNDLYQCAAVLSGENDKRAEASAFVKYLCVGDGADPSMVGMLSPDGSCKDENAPISRLSGVKWNYCLGVFTSRGQILELKELCLNYDLNAQNIKNALKYLK